MGLRERKKEATRVALRDAALRLALERGPENVRVADIADAAGVSLRTYNNYYSSREHAIIAAITAVREERIVDAILAQPREVSLSEAVTGAIADQYADSGAEARDALLMITTSPALRSSYADSATLSERAMADAIMERAKAIDPLTARVLAASAGAAARVAIQDWMEPAAAPYPSSRLMMPSGSLTDRIRAALAPLASALDSAAGGTRAP